MIKKLAILLMCSMLFSCGNLIVLKPGNMSSNQEQKNYKEISYIISRCKDSVAIAGPVNSPCSPNMRLRVELLVENLKDVPSDFLFQDITASFNGIPLKVFSFSELVQEVQVYRNNQSMMFRGKRFGGDDGSGIYQMMYDDRNYPGGKLNPESGKYFQEPFTGTKQISEKTESGFIQSAMYLDDFDLSKLYRETLQNRVIGKWQPYSGIVVIEHPVIQDNNSGAGELLVSVKLGGEIHKFNFNILKREKK